MPTAETLLVFTLAAVIMNLSPGPSNLYVLARTLSQGLSGGLCAVAGLAAGSMVHVLATVLGVSALIAYSPLAYLGLKIIGAAYLIYLGLTYLLNAKKNNATTLSSIKSSSTTENTKSMAGTHRREKSPRKIFWESVLVEVTNPKTALFYIALLPQFVSAADGPVAAQLLLLGIIVTLSAIPCDLLVAFSAHRVSHWFRQSSNAQRYLDGVSGIILTALGSYMLVSESRS